jgi:hypothetical protein
MKVYNWNSESLIYSGQEEAEPNPMEPGKYLIPSCSTTTPIPRPVEELAEGRSFKWIAEENRWIEADIFKPDIPKVTNATAEEQFRQRRNVLLRRADWVAIKSYSTGEPMPEEWKNYMQALRDLPENVDMSTLVLDEKTGLLDLSSVPWPTPPDI